MKIDRQGHLNQFYDRLSELDRKLGGGRELRHCSGRQDWPQRGVYFFFENGEVRSDSHTVPRVVRVGTHALNAGSETRLWSRLSQHRGAASTGGGNHRGSIFRLIVGQALSERDGHDYPNWGQGSSAPRVVRDSELPLERIVSSEIGRMPFLWLQIDDEPGPESLRGYIERNSISLLSNFGKEVIDQASPGWLGSHSNRDRVRESGLWNSNHVDEAYDPGFLVVLKRLIEDMRAPE